MNALRDALFALIIAASVMLIALRIDSTTSEHVIITRQASTSQENMHIISNIIEYDFRKIGHSLTTPFNAITLADSSHIIFSYDRDPGTNIDSIRVEYSISPATSTPNPNDILLLRKVNSCNPQPVSLGITNFKLKYFNQFGTELPRPVRADSLSKIREIELALMLESKEGFKHDYGQTRYVTRIIPKNLLIKM